MGSHMLISFPLVVQSYSLQAFLNWSLIFLQKPGPSLLLVNL